MALLSLAHPAKAQTNNTPVSFSIPAQDLNRATLAFARAAGVRVLYDTGRLSGISSPGVSGKLTPSQALTALLSGTGLTWRQSGVNTVTVFDPNAGPVATGGGTIDGDTIQLETIEVSGQGGAAAAHERGEDAPYQSAESRVYISEGEIQRFRGNAPGDFLQGNPGVMVGDLRNSNAVDVNVRGMQGMDRVPVVIDGAQQSNTVWQGYAGVATRSYIDPDFIGSVEIEKGPSAAADAVGATGGIARMSTIWADDILLDGKDYGVRVRGSVIGNTTDVPDVGTRRGYNLKTTGYYYDPANEPTEFFPFGDGPDRPGLFEPTNGAGSLAAAVRGQNVEVLAAYSRRKAGNYFAGTHGDEAHARYTPLPGGGNHIELGGLTPYRHGEEVLNTAYDNESALLKARIMSDDEAHKLEIGYMNYKSEYYDFFPGNLGLLGSMYQQMPSNVEVDTYTSRYNWNPAGNDLVDLEMNLWKTDTHFDLNRAYPFWDFQPILEDWIWNTASSVDAERWGSSIANTSRFDTDFGNLALEYGASYTFEDMLQYNTSEPFMGQPEIYEPGKSGDRKEWSAFISSVWKPFDWLKIENALRYTRTKSHDNCLVLTGECQEDLDNDGFAPIAAVTVEPWQGIQGYVRYAEAIRSPSLYEATGGESFAAVDWLSLVPEHARNWEAGVNVLREDVALDGDKLRFKAAYFDNTIDGYLTRNYADGVGALFVMRNIDYAKFKGAELSVDYDAGRFFGSVGYTHYFETEFCLTQEQWLDPDNDNRPRCNEGGVGGGYVQMHVPPKDMVTAILGARFFDETLEVGTRIMYVGERPKNMSNGDNGGFTFIPPYQPYTTVDLFANWKINENLQAEFNIDNVTDEYYLDALSISLKPAPGRSFRAGLTAKF